MGTLINNTITPFKIVDVTKRVDGHVPDLTFNDGSVERGSNSFNNFGFAVLSQNKTLTKGELLNQKLNRSKVKKAQNLGLRGQDFSNFMELNVLPSVESKRDNNVSRLIQLEDDKDHSLPSSPISSSRLVDVIKDGSNDQNEILSKHLDALNHLTTLFHNQNEILKQSNEIALEQNRINEAKFLSDDAKNKTLAEGLMSMGQSLEFMPSMIEAISIGFDNLKEVANITNSHLFQKNVNDSYAFNYDKDDEKGTKRSLDSIAGHLQKSANALFETEKHQKKQGDYAHEEKKIIDEENGVDYLDMIVGSIEDFVVDNYNQLVAEFNDFDIFMYLLENTTEAGGKN